jgi:cytochrome c oxidase cbb3-type subunit 4
METYETLRAFAASWGLVLLFLAFIGVLVWVFRPGARKGQDEAARMIFRNEDRPKPDRNKDDTDGR